MRSRNWQEQQASFLPPVSMPFVLCKMLVWRKVCYPSFGQGVESCNDLGDLLLLASLRALPLSSSFCHNYCSHPGLAGSELQDLSWSCSEQRWGTGDRLLRVQPDPSSVHAFQVLIHLGMMRSSIPSSRYHGPYYSTMMDCIFQNPRTKTNFLP